MQVSDEAPLVNTTSPEFAGVVPQIALQEVPENNYRWSAFALLTPGVVNDSNGYGLLSFRGQSTLLNNITIDGTDDNQAYWSEERGRTRAGYSTIKAAVQEFQVNTSNYSVEYGRSAGGIVNSVTKSGTNALHGEGYYFDRDSAWAAQNAYVTHPVEISTSPVAYSVKSFKPTDLRRQFGFGVGGPILKNKIFFFFAADKFYHDFPAAATILPPAQMPISTIPPMQHCLPGKPAAVPARLRPAIRTPTCARLPPTRVSPTAPPKASIAPASSASLPCSAQFPASATRPSISPKSIGKSTTRTTSPSKPTA